MILDYFYGQAGELFSFYRIPKALFQEQRFQSLSTDAKTLYGILLDRMSLSVKNGWLNVFKCWSKHSEGDGGDSKASPASPRKIRIAFECFGLSRVRCAS